MNGVFLLVCIGVGSTEEDVQKAYPGKVRVSVHPYLEESGHYLVIDSPNERAMVFETDLTTVMSYRGGALPSVLWIEGCS